MATTNAVGKGVRVGIVGGSIAGCAAAIEFSRAGYEVSIFERSRGELVGRGAGIATPITTLRSLIERDLVDADFPYCHRTRTLFIGTISPDDRFGHTPWTIPRDLADMHWGDLYRNLRRRVPDAIYHQGCTATGAQMVDEHTVEVRFDDDRTQVFDLVIFADGAQSVGRHLLFPDVDVQYRGCVVWRGLLDERHLTDTGPLESVSARVFYKGMAGFLSQYFVPGANGSVTKGERVLHWYAYLAMPYEELPQLLTDHHGHQHRSSLPPGEMRPEEERRLKALLQAHLPAYYAEFVTATRDTSVQPIYSVTPPAYHRGRICLIGDAGAVAPPLTVSGVFRGMTNARDLVTALQAGNDVDTALATWDEAQTATGQRFTTVGRQMEQALIWETPDMAQLDAAAVEEWWYRTVPDSI